MKEKIIIIGTGQHARMLIELIEEQGKYSIFGLISKKPERKKILNYSVLCADRDLKKLLRENKDIKGYACGIGDNSGGMIIRKKIIENFDQILNPVNIISPRSLISKHAKIGKGNIIEAFAKVMNGVKIGNHSMIESYTAVNHDQIVGTNTFIGNNVSMAGKKIGNNCIIGDGSTIGYKVSIGSNCIVNQGTAVNVDLKSNKIAYGQPLKIIKNNVFFLDKIKKIKNK